jgi:hypothetical protein
MAVDEKTGTIGLIGATSKSLSAPDLLHATLQYLHTTYTAYGHKLTYLTADAEPVFKSLIALFGKKDLVLTLYPPQQHAQRLERHQQTLLNAYAATLASTPSICPSSTSSHSSKRLPLVSPFCLRRRLHPTAHMSFVLGIVSLNMAKSKLELQPLLCVVHPIVVRKQKRFLRQLNPYLVASWASAWYSLKRLLVATTGS